jgi:predicted acyltransferase
MSEEKKTGDRLVSLDAYRGFIMLAMASGGLGFATMHLRLETVTMITGVIGQAGNNPFSSLGWAWPGRVETLPASDFWQSLAYQFDHVVWAGCAFWDLIQPSFMFMVGVALPFSFAARAARGQTWTTQFFHALWRSFLLVALAIFLSSPEQLPPGFGPYTGPRTNWIFPNVLAQIGLGYWFLFLLAGRGWKVQLAAIAAIAVGYILFFGLWPLPPADYSPRDWDWPIRFDPRVTEPTPYEGWFAHWNKNANVAHFFDVWFLNLFPRAAWFDFNHGGYQTLNFVPSLITMILGLMAGEMLRGQRSPSWKLACLIAAGVACLAIGWLMGMTVVPIVKRIWTPSWAVYSSGWTFLILALFYVVIDVWRLRGWEWPLVVVGMNSIAMYCMSQLMGGWVSSRWSMHFGPWIYTGFYGPLIQWLSRLLVLWLICYWLYRRKVFLRI